VFVIDASVAAAWAFDDEDHPIPRHALEQLWAEQAVAPALWWFELRNALVMNERRGRYSEPQTSDFLRMIASLPITIDRTPIENDVLTLARRHRLTFYDAVYLELALRLRLPLVTLDSALVRAATGEQLPQANF